MSYSYSKTVLKAAADDPVAIMLLDLGCRTNGYGVIDAAVSPPLHSPRSASRIALIALTFSPCPFSSIHRWTDSAVHFATGRWMRPGTGLGLHPDLATGRWTRLGDYCRGLHPGFVTGWQTRLGDCLGSHPEPAAGLAPDFSVGAGPGSLA